MILLDRLWSDEQWPPASVREGRQTIEQFKKDYIRKIINAAALEILEDTAYHLSSYEMPVSFCMLAVAFGFMVSSLVPFLGTGKILFGDASINLVWTTGGFVGAYLYSLYPFFQRYTRRDLPPRAFLDHALKVFLGTGAVTILGHLFLGVFAEEYQFPFAAVLGSAGSYVLSKARGYVFSKLGWHRKTGVGDLDVFNITGVTYDYAERLHEEGLMNIQNLAYADVEILSKRTMFNRNMLFDWKDEAILQLLTGNVVKKEKPKEEEEESEEEHKEPKGKKGPEKESLYDALAKIGVSNVTTLAACLQYERKKEEYTFLNPCAAEDLVKLLSWKDGEEFKHSLKRICVQGTKMLGEPLKPSITAFTPRIER